MAGQGAAGICLSPAPCVGIRDTLPHTPFYVRAWDPNCVMFTSKVLYPLSHLPNPKPPLTQLKCHFISCQLFTHLVFSRCTVIFHCPTSVAMPGCLIISFMISLITVCMFEYIMGSGHLGVKLSSLTLW